MLRVRNDERAIFSAAEEKDFRELMERVLSISKLRDISPGMGDASYPVVSVASLPFRVAADVHYKVRFTVEQGQLRAGWEGEILIVDVEPLVTSLVWTPPSWTLGSLKEGQTKDLSLFKTNNNRLTPYDGDYSQVAARCPPLGGI